VTVRARKSEGFVGELNRAKGKWLRLSGRQGKASIGFDPFARRKRLPGNFY
jgi:hypothetical protein